MNSGYISSRHLQASLLWIAHRRYSSFSSSYQHTPVLIDTVTQLLHPSNQKTYIDATFGGGGHTLGILQMAPNCTIYAIDRDPVAISKANMLATEMKLKGNLQAIKCCYGQMDHALIDSGRITANSVDGIVFDLGMSSMQIDDPQRGFSFKSSGPLDMRMDHVGNMDKMSECTRKKIKYERNGNYIKIKNNKNVTAADVINNTSEEDLADVLWTFGEEKMSRQIARAVVRERLKRQILTTDHLAEIVQKIFNHRILHNKLGNKLHPATRTFQAVRILINAELDQLVDGLNACKRLLKRGGKLVIISFHSLEDRIVKKFLVGQERPDFTAGRNPKSSRHHIRSQSDYNHPEHGQPSQLHASPWKLTYNKPIYPSENEINMNIRAKSAKLRFAIYDPYEG